MQKNPFATKVVSAVLLLGISTIGTTAAFAADRKLTKPAAQPADIPSVALPASKLPSDEPVQMQKVPNAKALPAPAAVTPNGDSAPYQRDNGTGLASKEIHVTAQTALKDVQVLPDDAVLIAPDGQRKTVGELRQLWQKNNTKPKLVAHFVSKAQVKVKRAYKLIDTKAIIAAESAAASSSYVVTPKFPDAKSKITPSKIEKSNTIKSVLPCKQCIYGINGLAGRRVIFTPSRPDAIAKYTILGDGFGNIKGTVTLTGFNKNPPLRIETWRDDQITMVFEGGFTGEADHDNVDLVVIPPSSKQITKSGLRFVAARDQTTIDLSRIPDSRLKLQIAQNPPIEPLMYTRSNDGYSFATNRYISEGELGSNMGKYTDYIDLKSQGLFKPGFEAVDYWFSYEQYDAKRDDSDGCMIDYRSSGPLTTGWEGDSIKIDRPMNLTHYHKRTPGTGTSSDEFAWALFFTTGIPPGTITARPFTQCDEDKETYALSSAISQIKIVVEGPAGLPLF